MSKNEKNYTRRILQMAADIGVSIIEVAAEFEWEPSQASSRLGSLVRQGRLVKAIPSGSSRARYYLVAPHGSLVEDVADDPDAAPQTSVAASTPPWRHDRPERVVYRGGIKVTIGPSADRDTRVQCGNDDVWGAGFRAAGIGRDVTTGKAWEDRK